MNPTLAPADQLVASLVAWLNTDARDGNADWPSRDALPALVNVRGGALYLPSIVVGFSGQKELLPMRGTFEVELAVDILSEIDSASPDALATTEAEHQRASELVANALATLTTQPGPLDYVFLHALFLEAREHSPREKYSMSRQNARAVITLQTLDI